MKKVFVILLASLAFFSCVQLLESPVTDDSDPEFKVSLTVDRDGAFDTPVGTKATVKSAWATGDVIFVFFKMAVAPKYLEIKRTRSGWASTPKNGLQISDLGESGEMTALYMPYGNDIEISGKDGNFYFSRTYSGLFYVTESVPYTVEDKELKGALNLSAPPLSGNDKFIHFDISGYDRHRYVMYQDYVKPLTIGGMNSFFQLKYQSGSAGDAIEGYIDDANGIVSFSGILDERFVGNSVDFEFSINDVTDRVLYTRDAGVRTLSESKYIGIGSLADAKCWIATEYVPLVTIGSELLCWARKNLGATAESGEGSYGYFYSWCDLNGYPLQGTFGHYSCEHAFNPFPYVTPEDDGAHHVLKGLWRMPSYYEMHKLVEMLNAGDELYWVRKGSHATVSFGHQLINEKTGESVFLPGTGVVIGNEPNGQGQYGEYWMAAYNNLSLEYSVIKVKASGNDGFGRAIRPVFTVKSL